MGSKHLALDFPGTISLNGALWLTVYGLLLAIALNVLRQLLPRNKSEPPVIFHWFPFIGSAISYGTDPCKFYKQCRKQHGDIFTFILLGKKMTVYLGLEGNEFILNGKLENLNAEEIYSPLTTPVFGRDIIYDCPNAKLMEQKKFVKFGLTQHALETYCPLIEKEVVDFVKASPAFKGRSGTVDIPSTMAEITIFTASRTLQGADVRKKLTGEFAELYNDLDLGFRPLNFLLPWAPLPNNKRRDAARIKMEAVYKDIINERRRSTYKAEDKEPDMIWHLMSCAYKNGQPVPDEEIAGMMITLLMAGQHSSSSSSSWIMLRLASRPDIVEELYQEQVQNLGYDGSQPFQYSDIDKLPLLQNVIKETLRVHSSIHSIMRKVMKPLAVPKTDYVVTPDHVMVASPIVSHMSEENFPNAHVWDPHRWETRVEEVDTDEGMVDYGYGAVSKGIKSPYLPFGVGRHRCIGEKFAYVNLCTIIGTFVRNFKFSTLDGKCHVPPTDYASLFSRPEAPAAIRWERRFQ
ncbi:hypothetical protein N8I77_002579 [Diaporthe amygdali]|uniref:Uncharacterized protein n=1 Tax=Phomopsis amygdali TaxID=1214568 RepID=A0AAD9SU99_PHOAM|nr:hypothetical protein N8I77_002579 [Diaporthe amygdali]